MYLFPTFHLNKGCILVLHNLEGCIFVRFSIQFLSCFLLTFDCCHIWSGTPSCYLELLDKLQKWICKTLGPSLAVSFEPLAHHWNTCYSDRLHDFSVAIPRCYKDVYVNSFFPCTARLWNSLPIEWFPLTYNLNGSKSRINRHLLTVSSL